MSTFGGATIPQSSTSSQLPTQANNNGATAASEGTNTCNTGVGGGAAFQFSRIVKEGDDQESFILRSAWIPRREGENEEDEDGHRPSVRLNLVLIKMPLSDMWEANVTTSDIKTARKQDPSSTTIEAFEDRLKYALKGGVDPRGRRTRTLVLDEEGKAWNNDGKTLSLVVLPDLNSEMKFELLSVTMTPVRPSKITSIWSTCFKFLVEGYNQSLNEVQRLNTREENLRKHLEETTNDFSLWVNTYREKAEAQLYRKFRDVLNEKKKKIRQLMQALERQDAIRKNLEEELATRQVEPLRVVEMDETPRPAIKNKGKQKDENSSVKDEELDDGNGGVSPTLSPKLNPRRPRPPRPDEPPLMRKKNGNEEPKNLLEMTGLQKKPKADSSQDYSGARESAKSSPRVLSISEESLLGRLG
ncbi:hypothetical protein HDU96_005203 [Phlyctochytrium bullatum]|nr:hypothetical protein HDU96_005203 [Phlyctochytrium bullatum]